jgi:hypothetical protein
VESAARTVCVLGTDTMSAGIVQVACRAGYRVVACDRSVEALGWAHLYVRDGLGRFAPKASSWRAMRRAPPPASTGRSTERYQRQLEEVRADKDLTPEVKATETKRLGEMRGELVTFKPKAEKPGDDLKGGREGKDDDLVLAVAMSVRAAERFLRKADSVPSEGLGYPGVVEG